MRAGLLVRLMVARFVVLAALIVVAEIGPAAAQQFINQSFATHHRGMDWWAARGRFVP